MPVMKIPNMKMERYADMKNEKSTYRFEIPIIEHLEVRPFWTDPETVEKLANAINGHKENKNKEISK